MGVPCPCRVGVPWAPSPSVVHKGWGGSGGPSLHPWHPWGGGPRDPVSIRFTRSGVGGTGVPIFVSGVRKWGELGVPAAGVTRASGRELVPGAGALLYYLPNGTRVTQEAIEQVGPGHVVSPAVSLSRPYTLGGPQ